VALAAKLKAEAFEGSFFERRRVSTATVGQIWATYEPVCRRENRAFQTDVGRAQHLVRLLRDVRASALAERHVEEYRERRALERTRRGAAPSSATLDREVELLKRMLNYAVRTGALQSNPLAQVKLQHKPNVRSRVLSDAQFARLFEASEEALRPILRIAFDTGMRLREILDLRWEQVDLRGGTIKLAAEDTKTEAPRTVVLTEAVLAALRALPRGIGAAYVVPNPATGKPWQDLRKAFRRALEAAQLDGLWFHDLRRSFVTRARKAGISESVVMRMSGHRTRAVFDRYNVVDESDLRIAAGTLDQLGRVLDTVAEEAPEKRQSPAE
jgi:integrase